MSLRRSWQENSTYQLLYDAVGDVQQQTILLLGNGDSLKELLFAFEDARVVYTDVSLEPVLSAKKQFRRLTTSQPVDDRIQFHAVDALHLPFADGTFDVIYGCAFVHHLQDLDALFTEVYRCLKDDGRCVFLDDAYSPLWQLAKATVLRPLQAFVHWRTGISPEDKLATQRGGYRREELESLLARHAFGTLTYRRSAFCEHLLRRGFKKLLTESMGRPFVPAGRWLDTHVLGHSWVDKHGFLLVWGYSKGEPALSPKANGPPRERM
jgi:ubiquinone/menaquinone biosynthesis C-methylase UbiE